MDSDHQEWLKSRSRELRINQTIPERRLWQLLRGRRLAGLKFVRQHVIGNDIVDFACREKHLVIEVDGESHADRGSQDLARQASLELQGYRILRFSNDDLLNDLEPIALAIVQAAGIDAAQWRDGKSGTH